MNIRTIKVNNIEVSKNKTGFLYSMNIIPTTLTVIS